MTSTRATAELDGAGIDYVEHRYRLEGAPTRSYGEAVAAAIGFPPDRVFKTLVAEVDGDAMVAVLPVGRSLSPKALAAARGGKRAAMADAGLAERLTGYVTGGISPFGMRRRLPTVLDESALGFETICVSGGQRGLQIEVSPHLLAGHLGAAVAPIAC